MKEQKIERGNNKGKKSKYKFTKGGFYAIVVACIIALGITSLSAYDVISPDNKNGDITENSYISKTAENEENDIAGKETEPTPNAEKTADEQNATGAENAENTQQTAVTAQFFVMPVTGEILKNFSDTELQYSETYCDLRIHSGLDIAAESGTGVTASGSGTVTAIEDSTAYGNTVTIDHGNGITAKYCGLSDKLNVAIGDVVDSTTVIGVVEEIPCESVERSHFHFEMFKDDKAISPLKMFGME